VTSTALLALSTVKHWRGCSGLQNSAAVDSVMTVARMALTTLTVRAPEWTSTRLCSHTRVPNL
jgi:hypothetical protein